MGYNNLWEGYPVDAIYSGRYTGIDPETGLYTYQLRPDAEIRTATDLNKPDNYRYYLGTSEAPVTGGFNVTAEYKGIRLSVNGTFATGAKNFEFIKSPTSASTVSGNGVFNYTEREQVFQNDLFAQHLNVPKQQPTVGRPIIQMALIRAYGIRSVRFTDLAIITLCTKKSRMELSLPTYLMPELRASF